MVPISRMRACALLVLCLLAAAVVRADVTLGLNAREVAMGGAGLASGDAQGAGNNPAVLAATGASVGIVWPSVDARANGVPGVSDAFKLIGGARVDARAAVDLLKRYGAKPSPVDISTSAGLALPRGDLLATTAIRAEVAPNAAFAAWAASGMTGALPDGARADVYAGGITTLPSLGFGFYLPQIGLMPGVTAMGMRVKPTRAYYSHYVFDALGTDGNPLAAPAAEMGGRQYLSEGSISADAGLLFSPKGAPDVRLAVMVNNLLEPKAIRFTTPAERWGGEKQLAPRTISVGTAWVSDGLTLAADVTDITGAFDGTQLRLGGELRLVNGLALRGGYNTKYGVTAGIGIGSFSVAYSAQTPVMISHAISF